MISPEDVEAHQRVQKFLESMDLDLNKLLKLKNAAESDNKKATRLVLPQVHILGLRVEFSDKVLNPSIGWERRP